MYWVFIVVVLCVLVQVNGFIGNHCMNHRASRSRCYGLSSTTLDSNILVRALRGESTHRTPVWLMRQAGRYLPEFRSFSEKYNFRERSETPDIAIELSLQPLRKFGLDGVIFFSGMAVSDLFQRTN